MGNDGGGIGNGGTLTVTNSTVAGIGGSSPMSTIAVNNSTIVGDAFGGVQEASSKATLANALIRGSCTNIVTSLGYNLESTGNTCGFDQPTDQVNVNADDLKLGPLADNGGPSRRTRFCLAALPST